MSKKPKILISIDWFLPGFKAGGPIKSVANIIDQLHGEFDFLVVTSDRDLNDDKPYAEIETDKWINRGHYSIIYLNPENQSKSTFEDILDEKKPDVLYLNSLFSMNFSITPLRVNKKRKSPARAILAPRGMLGEKALSIKPLKKKIFLGASRIFNLFKGITWHASTPQEESEIKEHFGQKADVRVAMNLASPVSEIPKSEKKSGIAEFAFLSRISKKKNLDFFIEQAGQVDKREMAKLIVYGPIEDEEYWSKCKSLAEKNHVSIDYRGPVNPLEIKDRLAQHDFYILPTLHENYGHSIVEALGAGLPVMLSVHTPWRGLEQKQAGWDIDLNETGQWQRTISRCIEMDDEEYQQLTAGAWEFAREITSDPEHIQQNIDLFRS
ncbi:glycosyltransferase [Halocola ammonii]